jgi:hypothetical protein
MGAYRARGLDAASPDAPDLDHRRDMCHYNIAVGLSTARELQDDVEAGTC